MTLQLAPYNSSMRLGCGFNSYTQQVCIDGAVVSDTPAVTATNRPETGIKSTLMGVPQTVTFKTEVIDKVSDLTDSLNINGNLTIKTNNASGSGTGSFVNSDVIKESDLNFLISCRVVNQTFQDTTLTKFQPLPNLTPDRFTDVFGDSFISGYQVGGEFNALISIKVHDKTQLKEIKANYTSFYHANMAFTTPNFISKEESDGKAAPDQPAPKSEGQAAKPPTKESTKGGSGLSIEADAKVDKIRKEILTNNTVTISVSWTGGGQDLKAAGDDWNFETLRTAAIKFPELVAETPVRTHAILTKYTALRSYHMASTKVVPAQSISYENAGIYTTMLQDAYLDYKNLLRDIDLLGDNVDRGIMKITAAKYVPATQLTSGEAEQEALKAESAAGDIQAMSTAAADHSSTDGVQDTPPSTVASPTEEAAVERRKRRKIPEPYDLKSVFSATILGLEEVKHAIRINMCRIVMEVDDIAKNPDVVLDESYKPSFMSPLRFKQFIPTGKNVNEKAAPA